MIRPGKQLFYQAEDILFIVILITGAIFRFYHYADYTITNDELSGIVQSSSGTYSELRKTVSIGVHPIGYYLLMHYWILCFGNDLIMLRLPFILFGIGTVVLIYLLGCRWFNHFTALLASTCFSLLTFTVLYSQLARPYSPGVFFSLVAIYCWTLILFPRERSKLNIPAYAGFIVAGWATIMLHYFGLLTIATAGLTGLFFARGKRLGYYILCGVAMVVLYVPFMSIFVHHLNASGLDWLGKPDAGFLLYFIEIVFNNDRRLLYVFILCILVLAWQARKYLDWSTFHSVSLVFFIIPFFVAYVKSVFGKPVLQDRVLLFQLPYLLLFLCAFQWKEVPDKTRKIFQLSIWGIFTAVALYSFFFKVKYFENGYSDFGNFKAVNTDLIKHYRLYGEKQVTWAASVNRPLSVAYYPSREGIEIPYSLLRCDDNTGLDSLSGIVGRSATPYFYYWWCHNAYMPASKDIIRQKFPVIVDDEQQPRHGMSFFAKDIAFGDTVFYSKDNMDSLPSEGWDNGIVTSVKAFSGSKSSILNGSFYGPSFNIPVQKTGIRINDIVVVKAKMLYMRNSNQSVVLYTGIDGNDPKWKALSLEKYNVGPTEWNTVYSMTDIESDIKQGDRLKIYLFNPGGSILYVDDMEVIIYRKK